MAYSSTGLSVRNFDIGDVGSQMVSYTSADVAATVAAAGYISDGASRGIKLNDWVIVTDTTTPLLTSHRVSAVNATTGALTLSAGVTIGA